MKSVLAHGTASVALMVSLMGTAHAQTHVDAADENTPAPIASTAVIANDSEAATVPAGLLDAHAAIDGTNSELSFSQAPIDITTDLTATSTTHAVVTPRGIVTPRAIDPFYRDINPFYGDINPFYGDIDAFWGHINPFYGDIDAFYRDISPFYGDIDAFWGDINPFYRDIVAFDAENLKALGDFWQQHRSQIDATEELFNSISFTSTGAIVRDGTPDKVMASLRELIAQGEVQFGQAYTSRTGQSFDTLVDEIFARHGANPNHKASIETLTATQRAALYLDWHDTLNLYSGVDAVDHWMPAINWTPAITQIQGNGRDTIIGIVDGSFSADADLGNNVVFSGGHKGEVGGHGAGVASLIAGAHDGHGVMGIAPDVNIVAYNPFSADGTATWDDVADGILSFQTNRLVGLNSYGLASIINLSLGESGYALSQGMADVLARTEIAPMHDDTVFVIAAGNDGITQTTDIEWDFSSDASIILVGSINPASEISSFSNRAGSACLLDNGVCNSGNELYLRTIVAPGEMLLVSDGQGGVVRRSGTSFAAPLVSGAISLLHDRWQWLTDHPDATTEIIFRSARDLGAPGPDEVYGHGLLDVAASQSPLNFNEMQFTLYQRNGSYWRGTGFDAASLVGLGLPEWWETNDVFLTGFETVGDTYRDFSIPASSFTFGKSTNALGRGFERLQDFVNGRFATWINSGGSDSNGDGLPGFTELRSSGNEIAGEWSLRYDAMAPRYTQQGELRMVHGAATLTEPSGRASFTLGHGQGSMALSGNRFGVISDHDPFTGGVNPVLGFASGETFLQAGYMITPGTKVSVGYSENRDEWDEIANVDPQELAIRQALGDRPAQAFTLDIDQQVSDDFSINAQYTRLNEVNALLGTQTATAALLGGGSQTEAMTLSASLDAGSGFTFDVSATGARTHTSQEQLFTSGSAIWSTSAQFTATKNRIFGENDTLRLSIAQPLQVENGSLQLTSEQVVDRLTGERAPVTQDFSIETERRITVEAVYAMPLTRSSEFGVFSRYVSAGDTFNEAGVIMGGNFSIRF